MLLNVNDAEVQLLALQIITFMSSESREVMEAVESLNVLETVEMLEVSVFCVLQSVVNFFSTPLSMKLLRKMPASHWRTFMHFWKDLTLVTTFKVIFKLMTDIVDWVEAHT